MQNSVSLELLPLDVKYECLSPHFENVPELSEQGIYLQSHAYTLLKTVIQSLHYQQTL
jgi:hypothetical protein